MIYCGLTVRHMNSDVTAQILLRTNQTFKSGKKENRIVIESVLIQCFVEIYRIKEETTHLHNECIASVLEQRCTLLRIRERSLLNSSNTLGETIERLGISSNRVSNKLDVILVKFRISGCRVLAYLGVDFPSSQVEVVDIVTKLVVARIILCSSFTTENACFFLGLDTFCTSGNTTAGDTALKETNVITSTIEYDVGVVETLLLVPVFVELTESTRAGGVVAVGTVVDLIHAIGRSHHF
jgi:hypothetical protein